MSGFGHAYNHNIFNGMKEKEIKELKDRNCAVIGKFKEESNGYPIKEVVCIKPKMYSVMIEEDKDKQKSTAKGIAKSAKEEIKHDKYLNCIFGETKDKLQEATFNRIESVDHELQTIKQTKISLCTLDDKRYYLDDNNSRAIGHYLNK